ncbi:MAG: DNA recombination protein RmuC [Planctomycetota bacterium]|nr:MAG: DNA recombination protein RmuC [Planctomycetota bacterium]REJ90349.1 MAG: DNA recombination protein RmuC [Planctomycetota bacterium]
MENAVPVITLVVGLFLGGAAVWFLARTKLNHAKDQAKYDAETKLAIANEQSSAQQAKISELQTELDASRQLASDRQSEISTLTQEQARLETTLQKERQHHADKAKFVEQGKTELRNAFKVLAQDALKDNTENFKELYTEPVNQSLGKIDNKIAALTQVTTNLGSGTEKLVTALQKPHVRGQWGQMHLRRVVEVAGMLDRCDFNEQETVADEDGYVRPDLVVHLPGEKNIVVDSKAPLVAFLEAADAEDEDARLAKLKEFCGHVRKHIRDISKKSYQDKVQNTPEIVLVFLPGEAFFTAALTYDPEIIEYAAGLRVVLAAPTTLIVLLRAVAYGWQEESLAENAQEISELAKELYRRLSTFGGHMKNVGSGLQRAIDDYNSAVGSLESRVLVQGRRFDQLGAAVSGVDIPELSPIETTPKTLQAPELVQPNPTESEDTDHADQYETRQSPRPK